MIVTWGDHAVWALYLERHSLYLSELWWKCIAAVANLAPSERQARISIVHEFGGDDAHA